MLDFKPLGKETEDCNEVMEIFRSSFPENELFSAEELFKIGENIDIDFECARHKEKIVGAYFAMTNGKMVFLLYLAVAEKYRSKGCGKEILSHVVKKFDLPVVVNVEDSRDGNGPKTERKAFYEKMGFEDTGIAQKDAQGDFEVLCNGGFEIENYEDLLKTAGLSDYALKKK